MKYNIWNISLYYGFYNNDEDALGKSFEMIFDKSVTKEEIKILLLNRYSDFRCVTLKVELSGANEKNIF